MEKIICVCGHENPEGTKLCEKCGRPLTEEGKESKIVDMRYDGIAIRSKTRNKSVIDKVWNFFSSVKVGVTLIVLNLLAASLGTIFPQEFYIKAVSDAEKAIYYETNYGTIGTLYYNLGLSDVYNSWWFLILVAMLAVSIIIASIDRGVPLHRSLKSQRVKRHESFMKRQRLVAEGPITEGDPSETLNVIENKFEKLKYKVRRDGNALLAERGRFARYGPYINHLGLITFIVGVMLHLLPGFYVDESIWVREGEIRAVPGMDGYFIENEKFILEVHDNQQQSENQELQGVNVVAKNYQTNAKLYKQVGENVIPGQSDNLELVKEFEIRVNHPLEYEGYSFYQMDFRLNEIKTMTFELINKKTEEPLGVMTVDLTNPQNQYDLGSGSKVELLGYYPDFSGFEDGEPQTASSSPNNPAFIFKMFTPKTPKGETSFVAIQQTIEPNSENLYKMKFSSVETRNTTGLTVHKNQTIPILAVGGAIFMLGVVIGSYWNHRRIWIQQLEDGTIRLAAHTNKNWFSIKKDIEQLTKEVHLPQFIDLYDVEKAVNEDEMDKERRGKL